MKQLRLIMLIVLAAGILFGSARMHNASGQAADVTPALRNRAAADMKAGNWKDAYQGFSASALDPNGDPTKIGDDLSNAVQCLNRLVRQSEIDDFREKAIAAHPNAWRLLYAAAVSYLSEDHNGFLIAGTFERGYQRGGGKAVNAAERDRVRALQLMLQAQPYLATETNHKDVGEFYWQFAQMLLGYSGGYEAWQLQSLTDVTTLPDYEDGYAGGYYGGGRGYMNFNYRRGSANRGAPVLDNGTPVYYALPTSWDEARNDGERWRWALRQTELADPSRGPEVQYTFGAFLLGQFGVQTMAGYANQQNDEDSDIRHNESGPYALATLREDETIARLANGIKRFTMPDEFNYIKIFQAVAEAGNKDFAKRALLMLGSIFADRRQYDRAAGYYARADQQDEVKQILGNWGALEPAATQPAGKAASINFRYRNGKKVTFTARQIDVAKLLADVEAYLNSKPAQVDGRTIDIDNIGYRLVTENQTQYLGKTVADWQQDLQPRDGHFDRLITVTTPLKEAGAYLLTSKMANGNESRAIIWVADAVIVKKPLVGQTLYFVADAVTGKPLPGVHLDMFGYSQEWEENHYNLTTTSVEKTTDDDGLALTTLPAEHDKNYHWLITAMANHHLAYLGFTGTWYNQQYDEEYKAVHTFVITDRPVYRPQQTVKFKFWVNRTQYDQEGACPFAGQSFDIQIKDPKGDKVYEQTLTADQYGGFAGELPLPADAALGSYAIFINGYPGGGGSFRVEEYKKPEYEVTVEAPKDPVMLGETITATVKATYYFGAPVTNAKVHYKVLRSGYSANWYPADRWDWFYGPGYWWFAADYSWYPGWREWGCLRPIQVWWGYHPQPQPEVVLDNETNIGADGTLPIKIDTALAKAMQGDMDHRYEITAEVTDQSRRTIVGQGAVLVARKPFKVYAWVDRGHYQVGDSIQAEFSARTLDNKPVQGHGILRLLSVSYPQSATSEEPAPVEQQVQQWTLDPDTRGAAEMKIKAARAGQYRLSYRVTDAFGHTIEGGYVFVVRGEGFSGDDYRFNDLELLPDQRDYAPGDTVKLMVNTNRRHSTVLLFTRPCDGIYLPPQVLRLHGKSALEAIPVVKKDMPNFFVEALTVSDGKVYNEVREITVPPEQRILNVAVLPSATKYQPGQHAEVKIKVTDQHGKPYSGSLVASIYDKSVEYISGGSNVPDIKAFFWKWERRHNPNTETSLEKPNGVYYKPNEVPMQNPRRIRRLDS